MKTLLQASKFQIFYSQLDTYNREFGRTHRSGLLPETWTGRTLINWGMIWLGRKERKLKKKRFTEEQIDYNTNRPHSALENVTPAEFGQPAPGAPMYGSLRLREPAQTETLTLNFSHG